MNHLLETLAGDGAVFLLGSTLLLAMGCAAAALAHGPIYSQRLAEGTVAAVLVWTCLAVIPLPRMTPPPTTLLRPAAPAWLTLNASNADTSANAPSANAAISNAANSNATTSKRVAVDRAGQSRPRTRNGVKTDAAWNPPVAAAKLRGAVGTGNADAARPSSGVEAQHGAATGTVIAVLYLAGAAGCLAWLLLGRVLLERVLRRAETPQPWLADFYAALPFSRRRRPALLVSPDCGRAFSCGVIVPVVVLPKELCRRDQAEPLRHVLLHELAHSAQRDTFGRLLLNAALPLLFFHPLYWWLRRKASLAAELVADDCAARHTSPEQYAADLVALMRRHSGIAFPGPALVGLFASRSQFSRRMEALLNRKTKLDTRCTPAWSLAGAALLVTTVALTAGVLGAHPDQATADEPQQAAENREPKPADAARAKASSGEAEPVAQPPTGQWPQWGGNSLRNNTPPRTAVPAAWNVSEGTNVKWSAKVGSQASSTPVVAGGKVFIGTNNASGHVARFPGSQDMGCLICFRESDGKFLWQHASEKLPDGRDVDWPLLGVCSSPCVEGERLWYVSNRGEVLCLDTEGFRDGENDGPLTDEPNENRDEADVVWRFDMMDRLGVRPRHKFCCSPTIYGDILFVGTSNSLKSDAVHVAKPDAPSFLALDKRTGQILWSDNSPGGHILDIQCGSPAVGVLAGVPQVIFPGGDGWLYSFRADRGKRGKPQFLWKFDCNPKTSRWRLGNDGTRNSLLSTPVIHDGLVYMTVGHSPEHGEGPGHVWCIDPTMRRGDVSSELAVKASDHTQPIPYRRLQQVDESRDEAAIANPNSAVVWHYAQFDVNGDGKFEFEESMHRSLSNVTVKNGLAVVPDFSGLVHCLDANTGKLLWTYDTFAACWGTPLIVDGKIFIGDEDGDIAILRLARERALLGEVRIGNSVYATPIVAGDTLYIASKAKLYAIEPPPRPGRP